MNYDAYKVALDGLALFLSVAAIVTAFFRTRQSKVDERFAAVEDRLKTGSDKMDAHELRIQSVEQSIMQLPAKEDHHRLELTLAEIGGDMKAIRATMRGMSESMARQEKITRRHEDHLREKG